MTDCLRGMADGSLSLQKIAMERRGDWKYLKKKDCTQSFFCASCWTRSLSSLLVGY